MNKSRIVAGLALAASLSAVSVAPAQAESPDKEVLMAQLRGHTIEDPIEVISQDWLKFRFEDYAIGRIRGVTGDVAQVETIAPRYVKIGDSDVWRITTRMPKRWPTLVPGADVIMKVVDGEWVIVSDKKQDLNVLYAYAMPQWVSRLDLKEVKLIERTAIDWSRPDVSLPPLAPGTAVIEPAPEPAPVPGLW
ncbi:conserved hypothetical protein [Rippkaea orientalis PCC 8801]|uniref:Uncharacterized protein n=1 Tax=Rippkaea orientalis (strain PCC 8801 / RF-1) TaxID=41431 RepID=B7K2X9_RIPO1|nr:hypothetical protein [Rippkaea orientalis]ACK67680.1 conserved hypothetical protein [Rippkaea orientalis PCC 8801]